MEQIDLPGFPANTAKVERRRRRQRDKLVDATCMVATVLERLSREFSGDHAALNQAAAKSKRQRGRPRKDNTSNEVEKSQPPENTTDPAAPPVEAAAPELGSGPPPTVVAEPGPPQIPDQLNMDVIFERFHQERLAPDPDIITPTKTIYAAFVQWFKDEYQETRHVPSYHLVGRRVGLRYARKKSGTVSYLGVRLIGHPACPGPLNQDLQVFP